MGKPSPPTPFDQTNKFYVAIRVIAQVRATQPALRYGRQYFRPISGDGINFSVSSIAPGIVAFSRILNDEEVVVVVNVANLPINNLFVIVDFVLHPIGAQFQVAFSNKAAPSQPGPVVELGVGGTLVIHEVDEASRMDPFMLYPLRSGPVKPRFL